jgi:hypothetical protein
MILILILIILILVGVSIYLGYRAYILAGALADTEEYIQLLEVNLDYTLDAIERTYDEMKQIDHKGAFESDDEAGTTFALLKQVLTDLKEQTNAENEEEI